MTSPWSNPGAARERSTGNPRSAAKLTKRALNVAALAGQSGVLGKSAPYTAETKATTSGGSIRAVCTRAAAWRVFGALMVSRTKVTASNTSRGSTRSRRLAVRNSAGLHKRDQCRHARPASHDGQSDHSPQGHAGKRHMVQPWLGIQPRKGQIPCRGQGSLYQRVAGGNRVDGLDVPPEGRVLTPERLAELHEGVVQGARVDTRLLGEFGERAAAHFRQPAFEPNK